MTKGSSNGVPTFSVGLKNQFVDEGATATYVLPTIIDPESDTCTIIITLKPPWVSFKASSRKFTFNPPLSSTGTYSINFNLQDPYNTVAKTFAVIV
jgi:hypothetical protein